MKKITICYFVYMFTILAANSQQSATVTGAIVGLNNDSLKIVTVIDDITNNRESHNLIAKEGNFQYTLMPDRPTSIYLKQGDNYIYGLIEQGDNITIEYNATEPVGSFNFKGKGSEKFTFINSFIQAKLYNTLRAKVKSAKETKYPYDYLINYLDSIENRFMKQLEKIKPTLSQSSYAILKANVKGSCHHLKYRSIGMLYNENVDETLQKRKSELTSKSTKALQNLLRFENDFYISDSYVNSIYNILFMHYDGLVLEKKKGTNLIEKYKYLDSLLPSKLKAPVLTLFLEYDISKMNQAEDLEALIQQTYTSSEDNYYKSYISNRLLTATTFKKGTPAPDFTIENEKGEKVNLTSFKGKIIYLDFWYEACGPCHALFKTIKPIKDHYKGNEDIVFLNVSIDKREIWFRAINRFKVDGYHAYTENKESDHEIIKAYKVASYPTTCIIDKNGQIFNANPSYNPDELFKQLEEALKQ